MNDAHIYGVESQRELELLHAVLDWVGSREDLPSFLQAVLKQVCAFLKLDVAWIYLIDANTAEPTLAAVNNMPPMFEAQPDRWEGLCGCIHAMVKKNEPLSVEPELYRCSRLWAVEDANPEHLKFHVCIPLMLRDRPLGIINVARSDWRPLTPEHSALLLRVAQIAALAIERDQLMRVEPASIVKAERERIARELHDTLMQGLTGISLQLETADALLHDSVSEVRVPLLKALQIAHETMAETRNAIDDLGAASLGSETLSAVLTRVADEFAATSSADVSLNLGLGAQRLPSYVETAVVRIVREGLQNVVRHAGAKHAIVTAKRKKDRLSLILFDDGRGFEAAKVASSFHGYGLASMRRRVQLLDGRFRLITSPGKGTRVEISIPI